MTLNDLLYLLVPLSIQVQYNERRNEQSATRGVVVKMTRLIAYGALNRTWHILHPPEVCLLLSQWSFGPEQNKVMLLTLSVWPVRT